MRADAITKHVDRAASLADTSRDGDALGRIGAFRLVRVLGRGGMAVVYLAEHAETGEPVALKTVESADAGLLWGIRREIHALRRVEHPGVVRIVAEGTEGGRPWYAMEVVDGHPLRDRIADLTTLDVPRGEQAQIASGVRAVTPMLALPHPFVRAADGALPQVLKLTRAICDALAFVHGMGLVHRDLKPENVMVRADGSPVLVDFGLAMQLRGARGRDVLELGERFIGTPAYMAPEQIDGELMDARVDLYALGCILYELVTGSVPFVGTVSQVLDQQLFSSPRPPSELVTEVPPALDALILALLQKRPRDRVGYADDVAAALARLGGGDGPPLRRAEPHLYRPRLAGRGAALATIEAKLKDLRIMRGARVLVGGESGVGKTRFALEVGISANRRGIAIVTGECVSVATDDAESKAASLHPFRNLLATIVDHCRERGFAETERILGSRGPALAVHEPTIARLPGQELYPRLSVLPAQAARARLNESLAGALAAFAQPQPILLAIEDLQWADEASLSFLASLDEAYFADARVLVLGTYRSEEMSDGIRALLDGGGVTRVDLGRIDAAAVERMVSDMIAMPAPPPSFVAFIAARSEGHPFFIAEYLRLAVQERVLVRDGAGAWKIPDLEADGAARDDARSFYGALSFPDELRALVLRRVAALGPDALAVAQIAAVLGREIDKGVLAAAMDLDEVAHLEAMEELRARQIIEVEGGRLRFAHDKLREIIHGALGPGEQRRLHAAAGAAIEARYAGTPAIAGFHAELVHHFSTALDHDKTFEYLVKAGEDALSASASAEALGFLRRALELDDARPGRGAAPVDALVRARIEAQLGRAALHIGLLPEAERVTRAALHRYLGEAIPARATRRDAVVNLLRQLGAHAVLLARPTRPLVADAMARKRLTGGARAAETLAQIHQFQQALIPALGAALQAVNLAGRIRVSPELARGYANLGFGLSAVRLPRIRAFYDARAREAAAALGDPQSTGWVSMLGGIAALTAGRFAEARALLGAAVVCAREAQDSHGIELGSALLAILEEMTARPEDALRLHEQVGAMGRKSGSRQTRIWALGGQGTCALALGHVEEAMALFEQRRILAEDYRDDPTEWIAHGVMASACLEAGDLDGARRASARTLQRIESLSTVAFQYYPGYVATGETLFALWEQEREPEPRAARARLAARISRKMRRFARQHAIGRPQALRFQGLLDALSGRPVRSRRAFAESLTEAERLEMPFEQGLALYELGRHLPGGDPARESHFVDARAIFRRLGQRRWLDRVDGLLGARASVRPDAAT